MRGRLKRTLGAGVYRELSKKNRVQRSLGIHFRPISMEGMDSRQYSQLDHHQFRHARYSIVLALVLAICFSTQRISAIEPATVPAVWRNATDELHRLIAAGANTGELLSLTEQLYLAGRLWELRSPSLPWATWNGPGWRWETRLPNGVRIVLASDGIVLVAIRERGRIEFSALDLTQLTGSREAYGYHGPTAHVAAASAHDFGLKSPGLFRIYYYFAGPTTEIVSSHLLPRSPFAAPY